MTPGDLKKLIDKALHAESEIATNVVQRFYATEIAHVGRLVKKENWKTGGQEDSAQKLKLLSECLPIALGSSAIGKNEALLGDFFDYRNRRLDRFVRMHRGVAIFCEEDGSYSMSRILLSTAASEPTTATEIVELQEKLIKVGRHLPLAKALGKAVSTSMLVRDRPLQIRARWGNMQILLAKGKLGKCLWTLDGIKKVSHNERDEAIIELMRRNEGLTELLAENPSEYPSLALLTQEKKPFDVGAGACAMQT